MWYEGNPCNMHLMDLATDVKRGVEEAGPLPHSDILFNLTACSASWVI